MKNRDAIKTSLRKAAARGLEEGDTLSVTRTFSYQDTLDFGDLTRDYNPVHYDQQWAGAKGLPGLILHGLLTAGMICQIGGQIAWLASGMSFRFLKPVHPGDTVTCTFTITSLDREGKARARAAYHNQEGELVVTGEIFGRLPAGEERRLLEDMLRDGDSANPLREE